GVDPMFSRGNKSPNGATTAPSSSSASSSMQTVPSINEPSKPAATRAAAPSIISADLKIVGDLTSAGDIQIDGHVEGDIQSRTITIGEAAQVTGSISGDTVRVCGTVNGQIKGKTVTLDKSAKVTGDILHQSLAIEPGAFLEGHCKRLDSRPAATAGSPSTTTTSLGGNVAATAPSPTSAMAPTMTASPSEISPAS